MGKKTTPKYSASEEEAFRRCASDDVLMSGVLRAADIARAHFERQAKVDAPKVEASQEGTPCTN